MLWIQGTSHFCTESLAGRRWPGKYLIETGRGFAHCQSRRFALEYARTRGAFGVWRVRLKS